MTWPAASLNLSEQPLIVFLIVCDNHRGLKPIKTVPWLNSITETQIYT